MSCYWTAMRHLVVASCLVTCWLAWAQIEPDGIEWDLIYTPTQLPAQAGWGSSIGANTLAEIADDGTLHIADNGTAPTELHCYSRSWGARPDRGAIAQATVKVVDCSDRAGVCLVTADGVHEEVLTLYPDRAEFGNAGLRCDMDTTDDFHTYQVRIAGINLELWVDGQPVIDGWGKFVTPAHRGRRTLVFGSLSSRATGEAYWRDVRYVSYLIPAEPIEGAENVVIYRREGVYACFPSLRRLEDGRLYTSFGTRVRRSHIDNTGGSARAVSGDDGRTWELTEESHADPRFRREDGTTIVPHARGWVYVSEDELPAIKQRNRRWMKVRPGTVAYLGDPQVTITPPGGESRTIELECPVPGGAMGYHSASAFLRVGKVWMTGIYCSTGTEGLSGVWVIRSGDDGETWDVVHVAGPIGTRIGLGEPALCDTGQGEIIAVMRSGEGGTYNTHQSFSGDLGKTWSPPEDTGIWGYPSNVIRLQDGRLLCTYGYRRDAMGVRAVLSDDGGHTWDLEDEIVIRADGRGNGGDNGYPISMQLDDGHIFTIYYLNDEQSVTHIAGTHWRLPDQR